MKLSLISGNILEMKADALIIGVYRGGKLTTSAQQIDAASEGALTKYCKAGDIDGCPGRVSVFPAFPGIAAERLVVVGLGKPEETAQNIHHCLDKALQSVFFAKTIVVNTLDWTKEDLDWIVEATAAATVESFTEPLTYKTQGPKWKAPKTVSIVVPAISDELEDARRIGDAIGSGSQLAKELGNMPANLCTPTFMAKKCQSLAKDLPLKVTVYDEKELAKLKMGCFLGVAQGSVQKPRMVVMEYQGGNPTDAPVALVGKGLTFDAGGISLKPGKGMDEMKYDMCGAASVIGTISAAASLGLPINIVGVIGCTENLPSGSAVKPGDILTSHSGKTVEVLNTDAEGRLVLCDLLSYTIAQFKPRQVLDMATLTGACVVALGHTYSGLFANNEEMAAQLLQAGQRSQDLCWRLPLGRDYRKMLKSPFADIANIGAPGAGACTAAAFLEEFVGSDTPWAHIDIAGTAWKSGNDKSATGRPVPLLLTYLCDLSL